MYREMLEEAISDTNELKLEIHDSIMIKAEDFGRYTAFTVNFGEIAKSDGMILSAGYHDTGSQLRKIAAFVIENKNRSLESILSALQSIVDTGRTTAISDTPFNGKAREIIYSLLYTKASEKTQML